MAGAYVFALTRATVDGGGSSWSGVTASVRDGVLLVRQGAVTLLDVVVQGVQRLARNRYEVTAADGTTYVVARAGGCGCGR